MDDQYIKTPGEQFEPGDIFSDVPFPHIRHPFRRYRRNPKPQEKNRPEVFLSEQGPDHPDDLLHATFQRKHVVLLSHGCELDKVLAFGKNPARNQWTCAPLEPFTKNPESRLQGLQERIRNGTQPNRMYIPENKFLEGEYSVDLRRITPLPALFFMEATKVCSFSDDARFDLYAQMGVNQSGYAIYVQNVNCPHCNKELDLAAFQVASTDDEELPE
jgi:hypothetical protein